MLPAEELNGPCVKCGKDNCNCFEEPIPAEGYELCKYCRCAKLIGLPCTCRVESNESPVMRQFGTGATRNSDEGKYDYEGFLSPLVIERYAQYMNKHRKQADGKLRNSDNWQNLFGEHHLDVCMKSAWRHFMDLWKQHRGYVGQDTLEDSLCALLFNIQAYLFKILKDKQEKENATPSERN